MQKISLVVALCALVISLFSLMRPSQSAHIEATETKNETEQNHEVVEKMMTFQWLTNKLYFAGKAKNTDLTEFYFHELEEKMEAFAEAGIEDDGQQLSVLMRAHGMSALDLARTKVKSEGFDNFDSVYENFISGCNNCHAGTDHGYIKIKIPEHPVADNQIFE